ncbi:glycosyltransferase family 2 protein [Lysinibacillus halotolerans]|uniref:Glycosyltransferase n=1 Tax=Lysinibacillus halotolerans TaxID=1368476 RepID=A0A3M8HDY0_9BACI|nr:glycosyltransferase [Lysinibacillus halotolerans]RND00664.1 glycosyltransferase [Lysinibacillus halotolerans]
MRKVSVIMPVYNGEKYIKLAINSVLNQSYKDIELIVVDDGSTDSTAVIVKKIIEDNKLFDLKYLYQENKGPSVARNVGIENAKGEYIALLDSDDYYHRDKIYEHINYLLKNPNIDIAYGDLTIVNSESEIQNTLKAEMPSENQNLFLASMLFRQFIPGPATLVGKRECFINNPYNPDIIYAEDYDLTIRLAMKYKFAYVPEGIYYCRRHDRNLSNNHEAQLQSEIRIVRKIGKAFIWKIIEDTPLEEANKKLLFAKIMIKIGNYQEAFERLIHLKSKNDIINFYLGNLLYYECKYKDAIDFYKLAIAQNNTMAEAFNNMGVCYATYDVTKAKKSFSTALNLRPNYLDAQYNLKAIESKLDNFRFTKRELRKELISYTL